MNQTPTIGVIVKKARVKKVIIMLRGFHGDDIYQVTKLHVMPWEVGLDYCISKIQDTYSFPRCYTGYTMSFPRLSICIRNLIINRLNDFVVNNIGPCCLHKHAVYTIFVKLLRMAEYCSALRI